MKIVKVSGVKVAMDADTVAARLNHVASNVTVRFAGSAQGLGLGAGAGAAAGAGAGVAASAGTGAHVAGAGEGAAIATYDGEATVADMNQALAGTPYKVSELDSLSA